MTDSEQVVGYWEHWYEVVTKPPPETELRQGDIIRGIVPFWLPEDLAAPVAGGDLPDTIGVELAFGERGTRIVLSASCDLDGRSFPHVLLAPVYPADGEGLGMNLKSEHRRKRVEALRRNLLPRQFMLADHPELPFPRSFVNWQDLVYLPRNYVLEADLGPRLRLRHPFREQFGNWVGTRMSDVGLEKHMEIPRDNKNPQAHDVLDAVEFLNAAE